MNDTPSLHPEDKILREYRLGQLADGPSATVIRHLQSCDACRRRMAALGSNGVAGRPHDPLQGTPTSPYKGAEAVDLHAPTPESNWPPALAALPDHEIIRRLDRGGMGAVYLARHKLLKRLEALKVIQPHLTDDPEYLARFLTEIEAAGKLDHPNVVPAHGAMRAGDSVVFVMKYIDGKDLRQIVKERGRLPIGEACDYIAQAARGLQHAFENKLVHRDVKPANLIASRNGESTRVLILDFGLAKAVSEAELDTSLTQTGQVLGTPDYLAPEQQVDARGADIRADIYGLGCSLYYLLTAAPPFRGANLKLLQEAHRTSQARSLNVVRPDVPAGLAAVVAKMLAKDPRQRYQTPAEVVVALTPFAMLGEADPAAPHSGEGWPETVGPPSGTTLIDQRDKPEVSGSSTWGSLPVKVAWLKRRGLGTWVAAGLVGSMLAGLVYGVGGRAKPKPTTEGRDSGDAVAVAGKQAATAAGKQAVTVAEKSESRIDPPQPQSSPIVVESRVKVKSIAGRDSIGGYSADGELIVIETGRTGLVTNISKDRARCHVSFDPPDRVEAWVATEMLEPE